MATIETRPVGAFPGNESADCDWFFSQFDSDDITAHLAGLSSPASNMSCRLSAGRVDTRPQQLQLNRPESPDWAAQELAWDSPPELLSPAPLDRLGDDPVLDWADLDTQLDVLEGSLSVRKVFQGNGDFMDSLLVDDLDDGKAGSNWTVLKTGEEAMENGMVNDAHRDWQLPTPCDGLENTTSPASTDDPTMLHTKSRSSSSASHCSFASASACKGYGSLDSPSGSGVFSSPLSHSGSLSADPGSASSSRWSVEPDLVQSLLVPEEDNVGNIFEKVSNLLPGPPSSMAGSLVVRPSTAVVPLSAAQGGTAVKEERCMDGCSCSHCQNKSFSWRSSEFAGETRVYDPVDLVGGLFRKSSELNRIPVVVQATRPTRPADMSDRLAALVGPMSKEEVAKAGAGSGLSIIGEAFNTATVRPPSNKARAARVPRSSAVREAKTRMAVGKTEGGKPFPQGSHVNSPLGIRKPGRSVRQRMPGAAEGLAQLPAPLHPEADMALSTALIARASGDAMPQEAMLKQQLVALAEAIATDDQARVRFLTGLLREDARPQGSVLQRMVYLFMSALACRASGTGAEWYTAPLKTSAEQMAKAMQSCSRKMPYIEFGHSALNSAILDEVLGESRLHVVDLGMWQGAQLLALMRQLALQPGGPPHLRVTGVHAPWTGNVFKKAMALPPSTIGRELAKAAAELGIPFEFEAVESRMENLRPFMVRQKPGEALVVVCGMRMQHLWDHTVVRSNPRDAVLQFVRQVAPRLFVFMELDADFNGPFFMERFRESLDFYHAQLDHSAATFGCCPDSPREEFELEYIGREIVNVVACEGLQRVVRAERLEKWQARLARAGFGSVQFNSRVVPSLQRMLQRHALGFGVQAHPAGGVRLTWKGRPTVLASAWRPLF